MNAYNTSISTAKQLKTKNMKTLNKMSHSSRSKLNSILHIRKTLHRYVHMKLRCRSNSTFHKHLRLYNKGKTYSCHMCGKTFNMRSNLTRHVRLFTHQDPALNIESVHKGETDGGDLENKGVNYSRKPSDCARLSGKNDGGVEISQVKVVDRPYECGTCGKRFHFKSGIRRHVRVHTGEKPFSCSFCDKTFSRSSSLYKHVRRTHNEEFAVTSDHDNLKEEDSDLAQQAKIHTGFKPFECMTCGKRFHDKTETRRHLRVHTGEKPYPCTFCVKAFSSSGNLYAHIRRMHDSNYVKISKSPARSRPARPPNKPMGDSCGKSSSSGGVVGGVGGGKFGVGGGGGTIKDGYDPGVKVSSSCNGDSDDRLNEDNLLLAKHLRLLTGHDLPFGCGGCSMRFDDEGEMRIHAKVHTVDKPFSCYVCQKRFSRKGNLKAHVKRMHDSYEEEIMVRDVDLEKHKWGDPICNNGPGFGVLFANYNDLELKNHKVSVKSSSNDDVMFEENLCPANPSTSPRGPNHFECGICQCSFTRSGSLYKHMRRTHKIDYRDQTLDVKPNLNPDGTTSTDYTCGCAKEDCVFCQNQLDKIHESESSAMNMKSDSGVISVNSDFVISSSLKDSDVGERQGVVEESSFSGNVNININNNCESVHHLTMDSSDGLGNLLGDLCESSESEKWNEEDSGLGLALAAQHAKSNSGTNDNVFECVVCGRQFLDKTELVRHLRGHPGDGMKPFTCSFCGEVLTGCANLCNHMGMKHGYDFGEALHLDILQTEPSKDNAGCSSSNDSQIDNDLEKLQKDVQTSSDLCRLFAEGQAIRNKRSRKRSGPKRYECGICGKWFHDKTDYSRHARTHRGEKPFNCSMCNRAFSRSHSLYKHMHRTHKRLP